VNTDLVVSGRLKRSFPLGEPAIKTEDPTHVDSILTPDHVTWDHSRFLHDSMIEMSKTDIDWDSISAYAGLLALAVGSIYAGAFGSLPVRTTLHAFMLSRFHLSSETEAYEPIGEG